MTARLLPLSLSLSLTASEEPSMRIRRGNQMLRHPHSSPLFLTSSLSPLCLALERLLKHPTPRVATLSLLSLPFPSRAAHHFIHY